MTSYLRHTLDTYTLGALKRGTGGVGLKDNESLSRTSSWRRTDCLAYLKRNLNRTIVVCSLKYVRRSTIVTEALRPFDLAT